MIRILIADDRELVRTTMRQILQQADESWEVCGECADGEEAIIKAMELAPDLIILDVAMPRLDGIGAARKIRALLPDVPILIYTFLSFPHLEEAARQAGAQGVVQKGNLRALLSEIRRVLGVKTGTIQAGSVPDDSAATLLNLASGTTDGTSTPQLAMTQEQAAEADAAEGLPPANDKNLNS